MASNNCCSRVSSIYICPLIGESVSCYGHETNCLPACPCTLPNTCRVERCRRRNVWLDSRNETKQKSNVHFELMHSRESEMSERERKKT